MSFEIKSYLLVDFDNEFTAKLTHYYSQSDENINLIVAGINTRNLTKLMFDNLIKDYCYCDFENEISVSELSTYLHEHHDIKGILFNHTDYQLADEKLRFIFNSLHPVRLLVSESEQGFNLEPVSEEAQNNHLSCESEIARTPIDLELI